MPSKKVRCYCVNCHGRLRDAKTVRKHAEKEAAIEDTSLQANSRHTRTPSDSDEDSLHNSDLIFNENNISRRSSMSIEHRERPPSPDNGPDIYNDIEMTDSALDDRDNTNDAGELNNADLEEHEPGQIEEPDDRETRQHAADNTDLGSNSESDLEDLAGFNAATTDLDNHNSDSDDSRSLSPGVESNLEKQVDNAAEYNPSNIRSLLADLKASQEFIELIRNATLENSGLDNIVIDRLRNPDETLPDISDPDIRLSLDLYLSCRNASEETYRRVSKTILRRFPDVELLSHYSAKKLVSNITGIISVNDDMCIGSCHAFTGPYATLDKCRICSEPRFVTIGTGAHEKKKPRLQATTIPLGPQIQALRRSVSGANAMRYQERKVRDILESLDILDDDLDRIYDDIFCGNDVLDICENLRLTSDDTTVMFSVDGAQLYKNKKSDTWIAIWIVCNYSPSTRSCSKHILPALIIPGPNKPKDIDSFLFRSFHHLSAIQREDRGAGIRVYDALKKAVVSSRTIFLLGTADAVGLTEIDGRVGHHGAQGCRKGCEMKGRHKPSVGHYYAAHLRPNNYGVLECNQPDFDFHQFKFQISPEEYQAQLDTVLMSLDSTSYESNRKATGISKPSILLGLYYTYTLRVPLCFTLDLMHLSLNLGSLFISLWRGKLACEEPDDKSTWDWVTLTGPTWTAHGELIEKATKYFPSSFHRPPRNPAKKISSGYKATEFYLYLFGLGPGHFRAVLPFKYWRNFCKLVRGMRIIMQRETSARQAQEAHSYLVQFVEEYEHLYYQRRIERIHFTRPCIHTLLHAAAEILRVGNGCHSDQYTMERSIGILGKRIRQPSNIFANLAQLAIQEAEVNAIKAIFPELDNDYFKHTPQFSHVLDNGYCLLRPRQKAAKKLTPAELAATQKVCNKDKRQRWGRIQLPNGQVARSRYCEEKKTGISPRISRNVKLCVDGIIKYAEVQYYFLDRDANENIKPVAYAMISYHGPPNRQMLIDSFETLYACQYAEQNNFECRPVQEIISVISMQPLPRKAEDTEDLWFVVEKSGLEDIQLFEQEDEDQELE